MKAVQFVITLRVPFSEIDRWSRINADDIDNSFYTNLLKHFSSTVRSYKKELFSGRKNVVGNNCAIVAHWSVKPHVRRTTARQFIQVSVDWENIEFPQMSDLALPRPSVTDKSTGPTERVLFGLQTILAQNNYADKFTLKPWATRILMSAGTLSPNLTSTTSPTTSSSACTFSFSPFLMTMANWNKRLKARFYIKMQIMKLFNT